MIKKPTAPRPNAGLRQKREYGHTADGRTNLLRGALEDVSQGGRANGVVERIHIGDCRPAVLAWNPPTHPVIDINRAREMILQRHPLELHVTALV